ncbi:hypothetical protein [Deinococcus multiflagellatus]|uniref:Uncharacterized protein n=1 Tax=Deinococcus multiflagellatus TaxID=1656887 RepID=A0ABW1ZKT9_9DEIO|nr:hypothetical protein [Deinococcus multiflagellatus]MBZ9713727.1 hypothetical protein [Deinococcus multiflagellatus]
MKLSLNLRAARELAVDALGPDADEVLSLLDAKGLVIVRRRDLPGSHPADAETLENVTLQAPATWTEPHQLTVITPAGETLELYVHEVDAALVYEAVQLQAVLGHRVDVVIDREGQILLRATAVPR